MSVSERTFTADLTRAGGVIMIILGMVDLLRVLVAAGVVGITLQGVKNVLQLVNSSVFLVGVGLAAIVFAAAVVTIVSVIIFGLKMYKLGERIEKGSLSSATKKKWMKALAVDLAASIIVGAILSAIGTTLALIGLLLAPGAERQERR